MGASDARLGLNPVDRRGPLQKLKGRQKNNCVGIQENYLWPQIIEMITGDERVYVLGGGDAGAGETSAKEVRKKIPLVPTRGNEPML